MTARINIVHKLYGCMGGVSGYMVKDGRDTPDEYRVYDAEGNFLYGVVDRQPWTVFRVLDRDGCLIYVGLTRSKHLKKRLGQLDVSGTLVREEYPSRQQAEDAEKRYARQMGFLSTGSQLLGAGSSVRMKGPGSTS
jgi:hypothetical protein